MSPFAFKRKVHASVFNMPHFISPGEYSIGIEPELYLTPSAGLGVNLRYSQGLNDISNVLGIIGVGDGQRKFRCGGIMTFDFFPDLNTQPGIGIGIGGLLAKMPQSLNFEITATPYVHKTISPKNLEGFRNIEPFLAIPIGLSLSSQSTYEMLTSVSIGSLFEYGTNFRSVLEFGIGLQNKETTISGGLIYYH